MIYTNPGAYAREILQDFSTPRACVQGISAGYVEA